MSQGRRDYTDTEGFGGTRATIMVLQDTTRSSQPVRVNRVCSLVHQPWHLRRNVNE